MDEQSELQNSSIRKRRNLSKNRGQAMRQREKTPEPGRNSMPLEDTTSDEEDNEPPKTQQEIEADNTYEEMRRLVQVQSTVKDPVYDLDTEEILEARAIAASEKRRRSVSPFALPDKEELINLQRKGSFVDPHNKMLSTTYTLSPKEDTKDRRSSLTLDLNLDRKNSLTPSSPKTPSPIEKLSPCQLTPITPKSFEETSNTDNKPLKMNKIKELRTPVKNEPVFDFEDKKQTRKQSHSPKGEVPVSPTTELVTKVIQVERSPSRKLLSENKPTVEIRERIVRTPSRKMSSDIKPKIIKQINPKEPKNETTNRTPPVKPARSKSASRFGGKTSESETSEDQVNLKNNNLTHKRKVGSIPRRFIKHHSPRANRSRSVNRAEDLNVVNIRQAERGDTEISQTSKEILELMQKARARSLSLPKDNSKIAMQYKHYEKYLQTPNKTPTILRNRRGISCPKTIQIINKDEILIGLPSEEHININKQRRRTNPNLGYVDASQSEYTSSCYSSSPSECEHDFDLSKQTSELKRKLNMLNAKTEPDSNTKRNILISENNGSLKQTDEQKSLLRRRSVFDEKGNQTKTKQNVVVNKNESSVKTPIKSRWTLICNWRQFKVERSHDYNAILNLKNKCLSELFLLIIMCGLGGLMFKNLEGSFENAYKCSTKSVKRDFIEHLWRGSQNLREEDWKSLARNKLYEFENQLHTAHEAGVKSYSGQRSWNFMNSFVYCLSIITTIGYGHIAPKTTSGRVATIVYALFGIPLFLIVLADFGKLFTRIIKFFWSFIRRFYYTRSCRKVRRTAPVQEVMKGLNIMYDAVRRPSQIFNEEDMGIKSQDDLQVLPPPLPPKPGAKEDVEREPETPAPSVFEIDDEFNLPISVAIIILVVYIIIGAAGYNLWESWDFFESFYFVFISMSTIGLGDLVPDHPMFMMASILYLVFGLALTSMCINVVQLKLTNTFRQASAKLGATIGLQVAEEDGSFFSVTPQPEIVPVHKAKRDSEDISNEDCKNR